MRIVILEEAEQDLIEGFHFYEDQEEDLGGYFLNALFADIQSLRLCAGVHRVWFGKYHRLLSKRFPFGIYYTRSADEARVHAVLDLRRSPAWIRGQMEKR